MTWNHLEAQAIYWQPHAPRLLGRCIKRHYFDTWRHRYCFDVSRVFKPRPHCLINTVAFSTKWIFTGTPKLACPKCPRHCLDFAKLIQISRLHCYSCYIIDLVLLLNISAASMLINLCIGCLWLHPTLFVSYILHMCLLNFSVSAPEDTKVNKNVSLQQKLAWITLLHHLVERFLKESRGEWEVSTS